MIGDLVAFFFERLNDSWRSIKIFEGFGPRLLILVTNSSRAGRAGAFPLGRTRRAPRNK